MLSRSISVLAIVLCLASIAYAGAAADLSVLYSVKAYGAVGDGKAKDTQALQKAIDSANAAGGGTVYFPPGNYLSGTIILKSNVTLHLEAGATLLGSTDIDDYPCIDVQYKSYSETYFCHALIFGEKLHDIAIVGRGTIDGQGEDFGNVIPDYGYRNRPIVMRLIQCRNINVENITMKSSAFWMQHYMACDNVTLRGLTVYNHANTGNDMLVIDGCHNVRISDCYGDSDDDGITLKSLSGRLCENITVTNCVLSSNANAIKLGTESCGGFKNVTISNCTISPTKSDKLFHLSFKGGTTGIAIQCVDGGILDRITITNITMKGVRVPIALRLGNRARKYREDMEKPSVGTFSNVVISNIVAEDAGFVDDKMSGTPSFPFRNATIGCSITGLEGHPIKNVTLKNIKLILAGGGTKEDAERQIPEKPEMYPSGIMFGNLPAYGFYCRHVEGLVLDNIDVRCLNPDQRPLLICDDVKNLEVVGLKGQPKAGDTTTVVLKDVVGAMVRGCRAPEDTKVFMHLQGETDRVMATGNDLSQAKTAFKLGDGVSADALFESANVLNEGSE